MSTWQSKLVPAEVRDGIQKSSLEDVLFEDPFTDETRKAKRNVVASSFAALLIAIFQVEVSSVLGLTANRPLGPDIVQGLACLTVLYFLAGFCFGAYVDYVAWKFQRERVVVAPFVALLELIEAHDRALQEQIQNATSRLEPALSGKVLALGSEAKALATTNEQLVRILASRQALSQELAPLISDWRERVDQSNRLDRRLIARFLSLWTLDIVLPWAIATFALYKTGGGVLPVLAKLFH